MVEGGVVLMNSLRVLIMFIMFLFILLVEDDYVDVLFV